MFTLKKSLLATLLTSTIFITGMFTMNTEVLASEVVSPNKNNITFLDPFLTIKRTSDNEIKNHLRLMQSAGIKYQALDLVYFDKDYTNETAGYILTTPISADVNYATTRYIENWLLLTQENAPEIKSLGILNGSSKLHISGLPHKIRNVNFKLPIGTTKDHMHRAIVNAAVDYITTYNLDGLVLDFEPISNIIWEDYVSLIIDIRNSLEEGKLIFICGAIDEAVMNNEDILSFSNYVDAFITMDYDTSGELQTENEYKQKMTSEITRIGRLLKNANMKYIPLGPGDYSRSDYHNPDIENARTHSQAVLSAMQNEDVNIWGSGVWWWLGTAKRGVELQRFIDYWVNQ